MVKHVAVIGAGIIGVNIAYSLTQRGVKVTLFEEFGVASGASGATFSWVNSFGKTPDEYARLNFMGLIAHEKLQSNFPKQRWFHQTGTLQILPAKPDPSDELQKSLVHRSQQGLYSGKLITGDKLQQIEPALIPLDQHIGVFFAREGWVDIPLMLHTLLKAAPKEKLQLITRSKVVDIAASEVTYTLDSKTQTQHFDSVILAAGNGTKALIEQTYYPDFPLLHGATITSSSQTAHAQNPNLGMIATTSKLQLPLRTMIQAKSLAIRPAPNGGITVTDNPTASAWNHSDEELWNLPPILLKRAKRYLTNLDDTYMEHVSLGTRVLPRDGLPIVDWVDRENKLYVIATHSGITLAPYLAECVTAEILNEEETSELTIFRLKRFQSAT